MIIFTTLANVFWEMSSYVFLAQTLSVFALLQCNDRNGNPYIATGLALDYAVSQISSNWMSYCLMYGNMKFMTSGAMSVNIALVVYIVRLKLLRLPIDEEDPNFSSPMRRFLTVSFFFISTSWFVQDVMDRFFAHNFVIETTSSYHLDVILSMLHIKLPSFYTLLTYYRETVQDSISISTLRVYCVVFIFKNLSVYIAIKFYDMLHQKNEAVHEMNERAKNYVIEDFLEINRITMKDLSDPKTEKRIQKDLELLEQCNYDYELYKQEKKSLKADTKIEKENFLNDIKKLKTQIQKGEKAQAKEQSEAKDAAQDEAERDGLADSPIKRRDQKDSSNPKESGDKKKSEEKSETPKKRDKRPKRAPKLMTMSPYYIQPFYTFAILQTLAVFFVALKYVATPFLCLITATLPSRSWFHKTSSVYWVFYMFLVLCTFNYPGYKNLRGQLQTKSEFRNPELESLIHWIDKTEPNAVFGAPIEVAAHILLTTKRPVVNHPLIEYQDMIDRTRSLYSIFSKRLSTDIYNQLVKLRVQYVVISYESCFVGSKDGLRLIDIFDYLEPENYDKKAFCVSLFQKHNPTFLKVFENVKYIVIQIFSQSIQLELKKKNVLEFHM
jgi:Q-cell neuroblast polarisation